MVRAAFGGLKSGKIDWMGRFIPLSLLFSTLLLALSGLVLFFAMAHRIGWKFLFLKKDRWADLYTVFGFLFSILAVFRVFNNLRGDKEIL
jgi:hypothetical protein